LLDKPIRVLIAGPRGRMGQEAVRAINSVTDMRIVGLIDKPDIPISAYSAIWSPENAELPLYTDIQTALAEAQADVWLDLTRAEIAASYLEQVVQAGLRPVIGTTGLSDTLLRTLDANLRALELGGLYAPNFAIGALLMMRAAEMIARFLPHSEIVEYHHEGKLDAPSGTARKTAQMMAAARREQSDVVAADIAIHSVRLPGFIAHQEVIFGGVGERLTIRHDSMARASFMPGVLLGIRSVSQVRGLVDGLEHFLW